MVLSAQVQRQTLNYEEEKVNCILEFLNENPNVIGIRRIGNLYPLKERATTINGRDAQ